MWGHERRNTNDMINSGGISPDMLSDMMATPEMQDAMVRVMSSSEMQDQMIELMQRRNLKCKIVWLA